MIKFKINIAHYDQIIYVYIVDSIMEAYNSNKTIKRLIKAENIDYEGDKELDGLILEDKLFGLIFRKDAITGNQGDNTMSHEIFHITKSILLNAGNEYKDINKTEESWAYLNGWLNQELRKKLNKKLNEERNKLKNIKTTVISPICRDLQTPAGDNKQENS